MTGNKDLAYRTKLIELIQKNLLEIIQNPYGNYVIQHLIIEWGLDYSRSIINSITDNIISLSMHKFSSNVVEKCLEIDDVNMKRKIYKEIFNQSKISSLVKNKYGNFVVQKAIKSMPMSDKQGIKEDLEKFIEITSAKEKARLGKLFELL